MFKTKIFYIMLIFTFFTCLSCEKTDFVKERIKLANSPGSVVNIAVAWSFSGKTDKFAQGLELGVDEINKSGGIQNRKINIIYKDDKATVTKGRVIAQSFVNRPEISAVIGHRKSYVSIPCASIYQFGGLLMLSPKSTNPRLTRHDYDLVFRLIPSDDEIGFQLADYMFKQEYKKVGIFYVKNNYGTGLANAFERKAEELGIDIVDRLSYMQNNVEYFKRVIRTWKEDYLLDAIFLAAQFPGAGVFVREARAMGLNVPIMGGDSLSSSKLWEVAGEAAEGIITASVFHIDVPRPEVQKFNKKFKARYGVLPSLENALGYDSIRVLAHAMMLADSLEPEKVAKALHSVNDWTGVLGNHTYDEQGNNIGMRIIKLIVKNQKFEYIGE